MNFERKIYSGSTEKLIDFFIGLGLGGVLIVGIGLVGGIALAIILLEVIYFALTRYWIALGTIAFVVSVILLVSIAGPYLIRLLLNIPLDYNGPW